ncbi:MAG: phosphatase PAP2 family protein [Micrococcales bacterium]|nr:phosphatase PAP2 family protein [Micrococcales bacterium]
MSLPPPRRAQAWAAAAGWTLAMAAVYGVAVRTEPGQRLDAALTGLVQLGPVVDTVARVARPLVLVVLTVVVVVAGRQAWRRGRRRLVWLVVLVVGAVAVVSPLLRDVVLTRPHLGGFVVYPYNTLPSTHMAVSTALVVAVVLLLLAEGRPVRRAATVLTALLVVEGAANVVMIVHLPADVLAGAMLALAVWSAGWASLGAWVSRAPAVRGETRDPLER